LDKHLTFVLSGGGALGALQAGALQALYESKVHPDLIVGTSVGGVNAAFLAMHGFNQDSLNGLKTAWLEAQAIDFLPSNYLWLTIRTLFNRDGGETYQRMRDFFISHGIHPDLRFGDVKGIKIILVSSDLNTGEVALYGANPDDSVLEGLLASTALPPWVRPIETKGRYLVDGGFISNLPIEPALTQGATDIIALDLGDLRLENADSRGFGPFLAKVIQTTEARQTKLELELAAARNVPVKLIQLFASQQVPIWDFSHTEELIQCGYEITQREMVGWRPKSSSKWLAWLSPFR
jgi:NTE family protein